MIFIEIHVFMKYHNFWGLPLHMRRICFLWTLWTCSMGRLSRFFLPWFSMIFSWFFMIFMKLFSFMHVMRSHGLPFSFFPLTSDCACLLHPCSIISIQTNLFNLYSLGVVRPINTQRVPLNVPACVPMILGNPHGRQHKNSSLKQ